MDIPVSLVASCGFNISDCGYCDGTDTSHTFGIWAQSMTCQDYQDLIDRGWRRSGHYVYKPNLRDSCCPQYTIRLDASRFQASKSQRKIISRFNRFIQGHTTDSTMDTVDQIAANAKSSRNVSQKPDFIRSIRESEEGAAKEGWKYCFKVVTEQSSFTEEKYKLYCKYQINIHHDPPSRLREKSFRRFLVDSPLKFEPSATSGTLGNGSFHQLYYLDDKIIAFAVVDILPKCLSSVYFVYDPDYSFLALGTYGALREIALVKELKELRHEDFNWYYMGFYIHTCQKMRYKGQYQPSYLLDPVAYAWVPFDNCVHKLENAKYASLINVEESTDEKNEVENWQGKSACPPGMLNVAEITNEQLEDVMVYYKENMISAIDVLAILKFSSFENDLKDYFAAVGPELAKRMILYL